MALNMERFLKVADSLYIVKREKRASDRVRQKEMGKAYRESVRKLHDDIDTYYEILWQDYGMIDGNEYAAFLQLDRPKPEKASKYVRAFLSAAMSVDKKSLLFVRAYKDRVHRMELSIGNIGVRIETEFPWFKNPPRAEVTVFDVRGKLDNQKEIDARTKLTEAFVGGPDEQLAIAQHLFAFVVGRTTIHLRNKMKMFKAETA